MSIKNKNHISWLFVKNKNLFFSVSFRINRNFVFCLSLKNLKVEFVFFSCLFFCRTINNKILFLCTHNHHRFVDKKTIFHLFVYFFLYFNKMSSDNDSIWGFSFSLYATMFLFCYLVFVCVILNLSLFIQHHILILSSSMLK